MKCKDCRYLGDEIIISDFDDNDKWVDQPSGFHQCERIKHVGMDGSDLIGIKDLAVAVDGSGYMGAIRVKEDFGCVGFEPKEA